MLNIKITGNSVINNTEISKKTEILVKTPEIPVKVRKFNLFSN